jgi:glycosyltransferase involved in cell wall biosynthesis
MTQIMLELERLRNINNGLGQFCWNLYQALQVEIKEQNPEHELELAVLLPKKSVSVAISAQTQIKAAWWHKIFGIQTNSAVWHCMHQESSYWPFKFWNRNKLPKVILTVHDLNFLKLDRYSGFRKWLKIRQLQSRIDKAHAIVCISEFTKTELLHQVKLKYNQPIEVIYNGNCLQTELEPVSVNLPKGGAPFVFSIGMHPKKQYDKLLPLLASQPDIIWVIAGAGQENYHNTLKHEAEKLGCSDRLVLCGSVTEAEKLWLYQQCEALWFPSGAEGFGLPIIEAFSVGKPVFAWHGTSLPEIGGDLSFYWHSWLPEHLAEVWQSGMRGWSAGEKFAEGENYPDRAKAYAADFTWKRAAQAYLRLYREIAAA